MQEYLPAWELWVLKFYVNANEYISPSFFFSYEFIHILKLTLSLKCPI